MLGKVGRSVAGWSSMGFGNYTFDFAVPGVCPVASDVINGQVMSVWLENVDHPWFWDKVVETDPAECETMSTDIDASRFTIDQILMGMLVHVRNESTTFACWETARPNGTLAAYMSLEFDDGREDMTAVIWNLTELNPAQAAQVTAAAEAQEAAANANANPEATESETVAAAAPAGGVRRRLFGPARRGARRVGRRVGRRAAWGVGPRWGVRPVVGPWGVARRSARRAYRRNAIWGAAAAGAAAGAYYGGDNYYDEDDYEW
uniref:Uncharacterized protein n=1 Tax=Chromera velia CCMP2878 TaxID=1169474 RepID=A0A0G4HXS5_9ALVE|eukprot:Cvel_33266.t1-p1 / transcript=Cvel_33266.t1 / gene=Cvel_33266 / organism=Chromera_velia_CCMP2878 / gene_product=hypothetical protein / transcript_product=hypothetical protein / location=Cvel_scaffold5360:1288-2324(+) / protein_length=260 / sequence_SO=supercontig / SO=protein_coding / is_pseudo=false